MQPHISTLPEAAPMPLHAFGAVAATHCSIVELCSLARACGRASQDGLALAPATRTVHRGQSLFTGGEPFKHIAVVRTGFFKSLICSADGREQVTSFPMAGDLIGLDGVATGVHATGCVALEDSDVCMYPFDSLVRLACASPVLQHRLQSLMAEEIVRDHQVMLLLGGLHAEQRVAAFLLDLLARLHNRGWSGSELILRMTRQDIGNYLGLTLETVSRAFSDMAAEGIITVRLRHIRVLDFGRLQQRAGSANPL